MCHCKQGLSTVVELKSNVCCIYLKFFLSLFVFFLLEPRNRETDHMHLDSYEDAGCKIPVFFRTFIVELYSIQPLVTFRKLLFIYSLFIIYLTITYTVLDK